MSESLELVTLNLPLGSLEAYIHQVNQIPMLSLEEEQECAKKLQLGDLESAKRLVLAHLRYVVKVAKNYLGYGLSLNDLIQEGNLGLMKAVKRFDANKGVRLVSFAVHWIKAEIHDFVLRNWRIVKVASTKPLRKLFFNLRQMKSSSEWLNNNQVSEMACSLGVKEKDVRTMEARLQSQDCSFDASVDEDEEENFKAPAYYLHDSKDDPALIIEKIDETKNNNHLYKALATLDKRSQDILQKRWLDDESKATLYELADMHNISPERVRQLEKNAMQKIRKYLENNPT